MATISKKGFSGIGFGILMPQLAHRFRLFINRIESSVISHEVEKCDMDFLKRTLTIHIRQPNVDNGLMNEIIDACSNNNKVIIDHLDGCDDAIIRLVFHGCDATSHKYELNYALNGVATHVITFKFSSIETVGYDRIPQNKQ